MPEIHILSSPTRLVMRTPAGDTPLPALWLRGLSPDPRQRDPLTGQRLINPHLFPQDLALSAARWDGAQLHLAFSDGFAGHFDAAELLAATVLDEGCPAPQPWRANIAYQPVYQWPELAQDAVLLRALHDFITLGFLLLQHTPTQPDSILTVARRFGFVRETNFGAYFEVYSRPQAADAIDLSYQPVALGPHTDNPYRTPVPGIQLLQCLQNQTSGGLSSLVDSLAVAAQVRQEDPEGFALLGRIPLRFEHRDATTQLVAIKPMIELNGSGEMVGVHYSPRLDSLPLMSEDDTRRYHRARKRMGELFDDPVYALRFRLEPGETMVFDNNRVLHGRTAFNPAEGHRQLQGCYIDRDGPRSLYRVLHRKLTGAPA